jgi:hypothetical protein
MDKAPITPELLEQKGFKKVPLPGEIIERILRKWFRKDNIIIEWAKGFGYSISVLKKPRSYEILGGAIEYWHEVVDRLEAKGISLEKVSNKLWRDDNHDHFWIDGEVLYESYNTIRGIRSRFRLEVPGMENNNHCSEQTLAEICEKYLAL